MAGGVDIDVRVNTRFLRRGHAEAAVRRFNRDATQDVAGQLLADWHQRLDQSIRRPTPYYETQLTLQRVSPTVVKVHDRGVVYGPWLEGTSSRNRTTRFRGYSALRRARQATIARLPQLLAAPIARLVRGMT
jgi:hypothetical protein